MSNKKNTLDLYINCIKLNDEITNLKKITKKLDNDTLRNILLIFLQECEHRNIISEVEI